MAEGVAVVDQEADPRGVKLNLSMESIWCMIVFVRIISVNKLKPITLLNIVLTIKPGSMLSYLDYRCETCEKPENVQMRIYCKTDSWTFKDLNLGKEDPLRKAFNNP